MPHTVLSVALAVLLSPCAAYAQGFTIARIDADPTAHTVAFAASAEDLSEERQVVIREVALALSGQSAPMLNAVATVSLAVAAVPGPCTDSQARGLLFLAQHRYLRLTSPGAVKQADPMDTTATMRGAGKAEVNCERGSVVLYSRPGN